MTDPIREIIARTIAEWLVPPDTNVGSVLGDTVLTALHAAGYTIVRSDNVNQWLEAPCEANPK